MRKTSCPAAFFIAIYSLALLNIAGAVPAQATVPAQAEGTAQATVPAQAEGTAQATVPAQAEGTAHAALPAAAGRAHSVRMYWAEQLSSNLITCIAQDSTGYLWIGTEYGLNKYDGVGFTHYHSDGQGLPVRSSARKAPGALGDEIVREVLCDSEGGVWVVTNLSVQRYDRLSDSFETVDFGDYRAVNVNDILQTPEGKIWVLHAQEGLFEVDENLVARPFATSADPQSPASGLADPSRGKEHMYLDGKGRLWAGFQDGGLLMADTRSGECLSFGREALDGSRAMDLTEDSGGNIIAVTYTSLLSFNEETRSFDRILTFPRNQIRRLFPAGDGQMLIGTSGSGLWQADMKARTVTPLSLEGEEAAGLPSAKVYAYLADRNGNRWLGCYQKGLMCISGKQEPFAFLPLSRLESNNGNILRCLGSDSEGNLIVGQEKGGLVKTAPDGRTLSHWMGDITVMTVSEDAAGMLWAGTYRQGLYRIDPRTGRETRIPGTEGRRIGGITRDSEGNIYTGVFNDALHSYSPDGGTERTLGGGSLHLYNPYINTLFTDSDGLVWIGHYYGIDVYDPQADSLAPVPVPEELRPAIVYSFAQSPADSAVWAGTNRGLFRYATRGASKGGWEHFTTADGLPNEVVCGLVVSGDGTIWASTYRGLAQIGTDGRITAYNAGNGLTEWQFLRGVCASSPLGEVFFGSQNGITRFFPGEIGNVSFPDGITLTAMMLGDVSVNSSTRSGRRAIISGPLEQSREITVSYQDNTFSLRFSTMDFRDPQSIHYEFRFSGEPRDQWYKTEAGRSELYFSHLSDGRHTLVVRACDSGVYSPEKRISIRVIPPWYRTWWAFLANLLVIAGILVLWWRNYWNRRQAEANEDKIKFFVDISHELRSPLTLIKSPLSQLLSKPHDAVTTRALRNMERNTDRLLALTNQILSIRKMETGRMTLHFASTPLSEFVDDICHDYEYQVEKRGVSLSFTDEAPGMQVWIDRDNFDKVVTNLINNAIKYTGEGGEIKVSVRRDGEFAELSVRDDGPGIDEAQLRKIFERFYQSSARPSAGQMSYGIGLNLTQKIVALHKGTVSARNCSDGPGAVFTVRLPLGSGHLPQDQLVGDAYFGVQSSSAKKLPVTDAESPRRVRKKTSYSIAVVDDDEQMLSFLETELGGSYHVQTYPDGKAALQGIVESLPDLVVSDVMMPVMDGDELLKRLKSNTRTSHIPVILLTTKTEHESRIKGLEEGADAYVDKPFNLEELETRIEGLIANRLRLKGKFSGVQEQEGAVRQVALKGNDAALMERIMKAVNERLDDSDFNVEALADTVGLSRVQLHRRVKELTGITVGEFIRNLRLQQAARLLEQGDTTVAQVTYAVGFANPTHFSAAFKKHFGVTPSEYMAGHGRS